MNNISIRSKLILLAVTAVVMSACLLPGMIPLNPEPAPVMEKDTQKVIDILKAGNAVSLFELAPERYSEEELSRPGTNTFTATVTNDSPVYFSYGWCATSESILQQNFEHISVALYLDDHKLGSSVVHNLTYTLTNGLVCNDHGILLSEWPAGTYVLESIATFNAGINDGMADYPAGDYISRYTITVK